MNPIIHLQVSVNSRTDWFVSLSEATSQGEGNSEFKPVKLRYKIDLVSYPARAVGVVNMMKYIIKQIRLII